MPQAKPEAAPVIPESLDAWATQHLGFLNAYAQDEDAAAEALFALARAEARGDLKGKEEGYYFRLFFWRVGDYRRSARRADARLGSRVVELDAMIGTDSGDIDDEGDRVGGFESGVERTAIIREELADVLAALDRLPARQRAAVRLAALGYAPQEIATQLGGPCESAYSAVYKGRRALRGQK